MNTEQFTPKQTFLGGLIVGFLLISTVGFFVMLGIYFNGEKTTADSNSEIVAPQADTGVQNQDNDQPEIKVKPVDENVDHIRGEKQAEVTLIEYSDIECPYCKSFHDTVLQLYEDYGENARFVFRHFPLDNLHQNARAEANATECAGEQGKFWEMLDLIFAQTRSNDGLNLDTLPEFAEQLNLDVTRFNRCVENIAYAEKINADQQSGIEAGARGTPYSILMGPDGTIIPISGAQTYANLSAAIESLLK